MYPTFRVVENNPFPCIIIFACVEAKKNVNLFEENTLVNTQ